MEAFILDESKAEALVEASGRAVGLHMDGEDFGGVLGLFLQFPEQMTADALSAEGRQKRDVHDTDLFFPVIDVKTACGLLIALDDEILRAGIMLAVMAMLGFGLHFAKGGLLSRRPAGLGQFELAGARVYGSEEAFVVSGGDSQRDDGRIRHAA